MFHRPAILHDSVVSLPFREASAITYLRWCVCVCVCVRGRERKREKGEHTNPIGFKKDAARDVGRISQYGLNGMRGLEKKNERMPDEPLGTFLK